MDFGLAVKEAMELAEAVHRLTLRWESSAGSRLAGRLEGAAAAVPARLAEAHDAADPTPCRNTARAALYDLETHLQLALRLSYLQEAQLERPLALVGTIRATLQTAEAPLPPPTRGAHSGHAERSEASPPVSTRLCAPTTSNQREGGLHSVQSDRPPQHSNQVARTKPASPNPPPPDAQRPTPPTPNAQRPTPPTPSPQRPTPPQTDRLLIDGHNFLGCAEGYGLDDPGSQDRLRLRLQEYGRKHPSHRITLFWDGRRAQRRSAAGFEEIVSSGLRSADDVIVDFIRSLPAAERRRTTLVTDDRDLGARARKEGARVENVAWLGARLGRPEPAPPEEGKPPLSRGDVGEWEAFFQRPPQRPGR